MDVLIPTSSRPKNSAKYVAKGSAYSESCMSPFLDLSNFEKHGAEETHMQWTFKSETLKILEVEKETSDSLGWV